MDKMLILYIMEYKNIALTLLILVGVGYIYDQLKLNEEKYKNRVDYDLVRKYLLNDNSLAENKKPILWIHIPYNLNSRKWCSFGSRNTYNLNMPYIYLTVKSIIDKCGQDFFVCLIDDSSFKKLLPGWDVEFNKLSNPTIERMRKLALAKVLYNYGGMLVPNSFVCFQSLMPIYEHYTADNRMFVGEFMNRSASSSVSDFSPNTRLMGCAQNAEMMREFVSYLERANSSDYTGQLAFKGTDSEWCLCKLQNKEIGLVSADLLGVKDYSNKPVTVEALLSNTYLELKPGTAGLYVPSDELLKRTAYNWFVYLSPEEVLESDTQIGKRLLICGDAAQKDL